MANNMSMKNFVAIKKRWLQNKLKTVENLHNENLTAFQEKLECLTQKVSFN